MKLVVVSPRELFRKALCSLLTGTGTFPDIIDIGRVLDLTDRIEKPQTLVLIIHTTDVSAGVGSTQEVLTLFPEARALLLADDPNEEFAVQTLEAGAWGCLSTAENPQVLIKAVMKVSEGERWFDRRATNAVLNGLLAGRGAETRFVESLTPREWEVLALIAEGRSDKEVASSLFISRETERSHVKSIYRKLQVSTRREAAVWYFKHVRGKPNPQNGAVGGIVTPDAA